jgi:hypothetical protein
LLQLKARQEDGEGDEQVADRRVPGREGRDHQEAEHADLEELVKLAPGEARTVYSRAWVLVLAVQGAHDRDSFGEHKGETRKLPAKKVLRFRVAKAAKDSLVK